MLHEPVGMRTQQANACMKNISIYSLIEGGFDAVQGNVFLIQAHGIGCSYAQQGYGSGRSNTVHPEWKDWCSVGNGIALSRLEA